MDKPEELRLADALEAQATWVPSGPASVMHRSAAELRRLSAENDLLGSAADKLRVAWRDEVHRLYAENASLSAALASSCDEQRHELWESGCIAGCERARLAERQRDALLEALCELLADAEFLGWDTAKARAAIKAVEEGK